MSNVAHFKANDDEATSVVLDASTEANNGVLKIDAGLVNTEDHSVIGKLDKCFDYEAKHLWIDIPKIPAYLFTSECSVVVWFKPTQEHTTFLVSRPDGFVVPSFGIYILNLSPGFRIGVGLTFSDESGYLCYKDYPNWDDILNTWHLAIMTFDKNATGDRLFCFLDNVQVVDCAATNKDIKSIDKNILIGHDLQGWTDSWFEGSIDLVSLYNHVLAPWQRSFIWNDGHGTEEIPEVDMIPELWYDTYGFNPGVPFHYQKWRREDGKHVYRFSHRPTPMKMYTLW